MWDERYSNDGFVFGTEPAAFLAAQKGLLVAGQRALAVADGEGRNGVFVAQQGLDVTTIDGSEVGVSKARSLAADAGVSIDQQVVDVLSYEWQPDAFDLVVAIFIQFAGPAGSVFCATKTTSEVVLVENFVATGLGGRP